jgi:hypothetical protein
MRNRSYPRKTRVFERDRRDIRFKEGGPDKSEQRVGEFMISLQRRRTASCRMRKINAKVIGQEGIHEFGKLRRRCSCAKNLEDQGSNQVNLQDSN